MSKLARSRGKNCTHSTLCNVPNVPVCATPDMNGMLANRVEVQGWGGQLGSSGAVEQGKQSSQQGKAAAEQQGKQGNHQQGSRASRAARQQSKPPGAKSIKKAELQQHVKLIAVSSVGKSSDFLSKSDWRIKLIPKSLFHLYQQTTHLVIFVLNLDHHHRGTPLKVPIPMQKIQTEAFSNNVTSNVAFPLLTNNTFQKYR